MKEIFIEGNSYTVDSISFLNVGRVVNERNALHSVVDKDSESQFQFESPNVVLSHGGYSLQSSESILFCSQNVNLMSPDEARLLMAENRVHSDGSEFEEDTGSLELRRKQLLDNDAKKILEDPSDPDFYPDVEDEEDEEDDIEEPTGRINLEENNRRYIVDGQMLHQLFKKCQEPGCGFQNDSNYYTTKSDIAAEIKDFAAENKAIVDDMKYTAKENSDSDETYDSIFS